MQYPNPLKKGDKVAILCPSTPTTEIRVQKSEAAMKALGFETCNVSLLLCQAWPSFRIRCTQSKRS